MKNIILAIATMTSSLSFANTINTINTINSNTVLIKFDSAKIGAISCVEQIKKDGTVVFPGVITKNEYNNKYSGFWIKDSSTCAFYKKSN